LDGRLEVLDALLMVSAGKTSTANQRLDDRKPPLFSFPHSGSGLVASASCSCLLALKGGAVMKKQLSRETAMEVPMLPKPSRSLTVLTLLLLIFPMFLGRPALAEQRTLYVDAAATENGDGSRHRPFWRITDAVERARVLQQEDSGRKERIVIEVGPGTYTGSYESSDLASNPRLEPLPIILNFAGLTLRGETKFEEDEDELLTGFYPPESKTFVTTKNVLTRGQVLLLIATTTDGMAGDRNAVSGFVMDALALEDPLAVGGFDIYADRVSDFSIHHNLLRGGTSGIGTRYASGTVEANFRPANSANSPGIFMTGGSMVHPARVTLRRNRSTQNALGATVGAVANFVQLDLGTSALRLEPLQTTYDPTNPDDQKNIPDTFEVRIEDNDFSNNRSFGLKCGFFPPFYYTTVDATQPITGILNVLVRNNRFNANGDYGIIVDAFMPSRSNPRELTGMFEATFEHNSFIDNGRKVALFDFTQVGASLGRMSRQDYKYIQDSTFQVADLDGELEGFDYDHPLDDPYDGSPVVGNFLIVNGDLQPNGIWITPIR
jgi:hypothetical protein